MQENQGVAYECMYTVVWCTKYRRKVLRSEITNRLATILVSEAGNIHAEVLHLDITEDTVRMRIVVDPQYGINRAVRHLKGLSSRMLRNEYPELKSRIPCLWTGNYFVVTEATAQNVDSLVDEFISQQERSQKTTRKNQEET